MFYVRINNLSWLSEQQPTCIYAYQMRLCYFSSTWIKWQSTYTHTFHKELYSFAYGRYLQMLNGMFTHSIFSTILFILHWFKQICWPFAFDLIRMPHFTFYHCFTGFHLVQLHENKNANVLFNCSRNILPSYLS